MPNMKMIQVPFRERKPAVEYCNRLLEKGYDAKITETKDKNGEVIWEVCASHTPYMKRALRY